jgi:DNA-binding response OmpR family regulator
MPATILLIEDEPAIQELLTVNLKHAGYGVRSALDAQQALEQIQQVLPDLILLDWMLPDQPGIRLARQLRGDARTRDIPLIMLTARSAEQDKVDGLEAGADDYLTKPFAPKELSARIRALLRRARSLDPGSPQMVFCDLEIIPDQGVVRLAGEEAHLTKTEFRLLVELASNPGRVLSREVLLERVWGYGYFGDGRLVDVHVRRLRTKIEPDPANPSYVVTIRGLGYKLKT